MTCRCAPWPRSPPRTYRGDLGAAVADVRTWLRAGHRVVVVQPGHGPAERMVEVLAEHDVPARLVDDLPTADLLAAHVVTVTTRLAGDTASSTTEHGLVVLTGDDLVGPEGAPPATCARCRRGARRQIDPLELERRRLRRPRAARRRPLRRDEAARGAGRDPRVPRPRVRRLQARRPAGPALRAGRRARPGHPLRRRRAALASTGSAAPTGPSARAGPARRSARSRPS